MKKNKDTLLTILLAISIIANSFLLGAVVSPKVHFAFNKRPHSDIPMPPPEFRMERIVKSLPEEYRSTVSDIISNHHENTFKTAHNIREIFAEMDSILTAEKFDEQKFIAITNRIDEDDKFMKKNMLAMTLEIARILPDEQRISFFQQLSEKKGKMHNFFDKRNEDKPRNRSNKQKFSSKK